MAKLPRKIMKVLGLNSASNGKFGSARAGTKILSNDPDTIQGLLAWGLGWFQATLSGSNLPALEEKQGVDFVTTYQLAYLMQEGVPEWHAGTTYYINSIAKHTDGVLYKSLQNDNLNHPVTDGAWWSVAINAGITALTGDVTASGSGSVTATIANAPLASIKNLTTSANQMLYTTAANTYATTTLTAAGRDLLDDTSFSAMRTTLGLGTAATVNTGTSGATIPLLNAATNTWSGSQIVGGLGVSAYTTPDSSNGLIQSGVGSGPPAYSSVANSTGARTHFVFTNPNGIVGSISTNASATTYSTSSDVRLKEDIRAIENSGEIIDALNPVNHGWKADDSRNHGFIAQELFEVFPEAVVKGDDDLNKQSGDEGFMPWGVDQSKLIAVLVAEVKSLRSRVALVENR